MDNRILFIAVVIVLGVMFFMYKDKKSPLPPPLLQNSSTKSTSVYDKVHRGLLSGMTLNQFKDISGMDSISYFELKQLYDDYIKKGLNPANITSKEYDEILSN